MKTPLTLLLPALLTLGLSLAPQARGDDAPAPLSREADYQRMFTLLHLPMPGPLPAMADDSNRTPGARLLPDGRHWADGAGNGVGRSEWGTWSNYNEAKANPFPLTDPLRLKNGGAVTDATT